MSLTVIVTPLLRYMNGHRDDPAVLGLHSSVLHSSPLLLPPIIDDYDGKVWMFLESTSIT